MNSIVERAVIEEYNKILAYIPEVIKTRPQNTIYHYTSAHGLESILRSRNMWFTRWDCLNDSSEYLEIHDIINKRIEKYKNYNAFYEMVVAWNNLSRKEKQNKFYEDTHLDLYIASFSNLSDALNMWTYYTKSNSSDGYCIGFNSGTVFADKKVDLSIHHVFYAETDKTQIIDELIKKLYDFYIFIKEQTSTEPQFTELFVSNYINTACAYIGCFFKHSAFSVENEVRAALFIKNEEGYKRLEKEHRVSQGVIIPYTELKFENQDILSVTLSPTLDESIASTGVQYLRDQFNYNFEIKNSTIPFRNI